jgi:uncharacterized protein
VDKLDYSHAANNDFEPDCGSATNPMFAEVVAQRYGRRDLVKGSLAVAVGTILAGNAVAEPLARWSKGRPGDKDHGPKRPLLNFDPVPMNSDDLVTLPSGYSQQVFIPWGEPICGKYPPYRPDGTNTGEDQEQQIGMHHDGMHYFPMWHGPRGSEHGLLCVNHEYIDQAPLHPNGPTLVDGKRPFDEVRKEVAAHGVSVVEIKKGGSGWKVVRGSKYNRRITGATKMEITGPVRGSSFVKTAFSPKGTHCRGTLNNCAHGYTPWGTYLTCEENWAGYLINRAPRPREQSKYGVATSGSRYGWETAGGEYARFDVTPTAADATGDYRNEANTFGWVVEIDPFDPKSTPKKRTALGRTAHEGAWMAPVKPGRPVVVYMGDDSTNQYVYKFVTADVYHPRKSTGDMLDHGTLFVAVFNADGTGEWRALEFADPQFKAAMEAYAATDPTFVPFTSQAEVLVNTRLAADIVGATKMDRPEWAAIDPRTGEVYLTLTNNSGRSEVDAANPRPQNVDGHIIRWREHHNRYDSPTFDWDIFVLGGPTKQTTDALGRDPIYAAQVFPGTRKQAYLGDEAHFNSPDGLWFDSRGVLWIQTDGYSDASEGFGNQQMLAADPRTGEIKRFFVGPVGSEVTGVDMTPDNRNMFVNIQHPEGGSTWPDGGRPRSATVVVTHQRGSVIGR